MQSILRAREHYHGNRNIWWSAKPKEYEWLNKMDLYHQIAGQVFFTEQAIQDGLAKIPETHWISIGYDSFCENPDTTYKMLQHKYDKLGCNLPDNPQSSFIFKPRDELRLSDAEADLFLSAYNAFETGLLHP
jgi:hypothetical protein